MSSLPARPYSFKPRGLYDALSGDGAPDGACGILQNLIHDITTPFIWIVRPAAQQVTNFSSFASPGDISVAMSVGNYVFGMISTARFPGYDEPFCFNAALNIFAPVSGTTGTNLPATQPSSGPWTPPTMAVVGSTIVVTHPGFDGVGSNFFGVIDITAIDTPSWTTSNTATQALTSVPLACFAFDNRMWYVQNNQAWFSDALAPTTITNSTQFLTLGSTGSAIQAFAGLPIQQTQGGVLAALLGFKNEGYWQIVPDATTTYTLNGPFKPGTDAPRSVVQTPNGVMYKGDGGIRMVNLTGTPLPTPVGGVRAPFELAFEPSRICAAYSDTIYRVGLQTTTNPLSGENGFVEYWWDFEISEWSGPHTFSSSVMVPYDDGFICATTRAPGALFTSPVHNTQNSSVVELGATMPVRLQSVILAQDDAMVNKKLVQSQIDISFGSASNTLIVQFLSAAQGAAGNASVSAIVGTYWNQFNWNQANWSSAQYGLRTYDINWDAPVVYKTGAFTIYGSATPNLRIGTARFRTQLLNQQNTQNPP